MPKMKTKRGLAKRIRKTGSGKLVRHHAYTGHKAPRKTTKQKRHLMKQTSVHKTDAKRIKDLLQN